MSIPSVRRATACAGVAALLIAGCAHTPKPKPNPEAAGPTSPPANTTPPERQHYILELLEAGKRDQARVETQQLLKEQPNNTEAATFLNEIDGDPQTLLGDKSFAYTIQPGETLPTLADRFLGDSNLFYALARYNNIDVPSSAAPGLTILVPSTKHDSHTGEGEAADHPAHSERAEPTEHSSHSERTEHEAPEHPAHADHPEPTEHPAHTERADHEDPAAPVLRKRTEPPAEVKKPPAPTAPEKPAAAPAAPAAAARDPAHANALRSEALVQLDKGEVDHAVSLLREASRLEPDSQPIAADLARALRIQSATHK